MLEKLLGVGSFGGYIGHLICSQVTFFIFWTSLASFP
jgi:hypothetical protein